MNQVRESAKALGTIEQTSPEAEPAQEVVPIKPLRFRLQLDPNAPYLKERGLSAETIKRFGLGQCRRGMLRDYIAIPVYRYPRDDAENPVAYLGRYPGEDYDADAGRPRYRWPPTFPKSEILYGLNEAISSGDPTGPLIVVEGVFSVYHLVQSGLPDVVATFGASLSDAQSKLLIQLGRPICLLYDGNEPGRAGALTAAAKLIRDLFVRIIQLPDGTEPDQLSAHELRTFMQFCRRLSSPVEAS